MDVKAADSEFRAGNLFSVATCAGGITILDVVRLRQGISPAEALNLAAWLIALSEIKSNARISDESILAAVTAVRST